MFYWNYRQRCQLEEYWIIPTSEVIDTKGGELNKRGRVGSFVEILYQRRVIINWNRWWIFPKNWKWPPPPPLTIWHARVGHSPCITYGLLVFSRFFCRITLSSTEDRYWDQQTVSWVLLKVILEKDIYIYIYVYITLIYLSYIYKYILQPVHNERIVSFFRSQCKMFWSHTSLKVSLKNTLSSVRLVPQESKTNHTGKQWSPAKHLSKSTT